MNPESPQPSQSSQPGTPGRSPLVAGIIVIAVLVLVIGGISLASKGDDPADTAETSTSETTDSQSDDDTPSEEPPAEGDDNEVTYANGTYEGSGSYRSPGGTEEVEVSLTLDGNKITAVEVTTDPASATSQQYQNEFKDNYKDMVVGKNIDDVKLSKVSGSSLTSQGFNAAIQQIKDQAQSA